MIGVRVYLANKNKFSPLAAEVGMELLASAPTGLPLIYGDDETRLEQGPI